MARDTILLKYPDAWEKLWRRLGVATAKPLGKMPRDDAVKALRYNFNWTLQDIADLFDLSRERVRQIAPDLSHRGLKNKREATWQDIDYWLTVACHEPKAWTSKGALSSRWLKKQLAPLKFSVNMRDPRLSKFQIIMRCGLGLNDRTSQLNQMYEWQYGVHYYSYREIAEMLSRRFVPLGTMVVFYGAEAIGYKGHSTGAPGQARQFVPDEAWGQDEDV